jgi:cysteinyl-tRNA synthetase
MPDESKHLNKEDLFLLMESYRNMITMHSTLVEQQKQIINLQNNMIKKQDEISIKQNKSCDQLSRITEKLGECTDNLTKTNDNIQSHCLSLDKSMTSLFDGIKDRISETKLEATKQHSGINLRIYVAMGAMATIIITILAMGGTLIEKFTLIHSMHDMLRNVVDFITKIAP